MGHLETHVFIVGNSFVPRFCSKPTETCANVKMIVNTQCSIGSWNMRTDWSVICATASSKVDLLLKDTRMKCSVMVLLDMNANNVQTAFAMGNS